MYTKRNDHTRGINLGLQSDTLTNLTKDKLAF